MSRSQNQSILQILTTVKPVLQRLILIHADLSFIKFLIDCVFLMWLRGTFACQIKMLHPNTFVKILRPGFRKK